MKVLILTHGTRGDVQPFVALASALTNSGHETLVGAPAASASLVESYALRFVPLADGPNRLMADPIVREAFETNYRRARGKKLAVQLARKYRPMMDPVLDDMAKAGGLGADVVVHHIVLPGQEVAEWLEVPAVPVCMQPFWTPTKAFPNPMMSLPLPDSFNRLSYLSTKIWYQILAGRTGRWRKEVLCLPRRRGHRDVLCRPDGGPATVLQAFTKHLLMPPPDDYPDWVHTTGFWFAPAPPDWAPPRALSEFLAAGDPPVYIGFGSMAGTDPEGIGGLVKQAVHLAGVRAVVVAGWGGVRFERTDDDILFLQQAPHDWLFPQTAAVVHHGGSGTTGAALAAGRPQVVCPFVGDQPYYARRLYAAGVAPPPLPQRALTADRLADAIRQAVTDPIMAVHARRLRERVRTEGGVGSALEVIEALVEKS